MTGVPSAAEGNTASVDAPAALVAAFPRRGRHRMPARTRAVLALGRAAGGAQVGQLAAAGLWSFVVVAATAVPLAVYG